jgi:phosphoadenosine phosphosulfate reductase
MSESATRTIQATLAGTSLIDTAIQRIRDHEPADGYEVGFSGGKDSIVILDLVKKSGVKYEARYKSTTVDPPEITKFIKENYPDVVWDKPRYSMFKLIEKRGMLPTRVIRFCCTELKEFGGAGKTIITGVRSAESVKRAKRSIYEESRRTKNKFFLHPIFEWTTEDVWTYIIINGLKYCSLYDEGYDRLGCIMCPLQGEKGMRLDAERHPKHFTAYKRAIATAIKKGTSKFPEGKTPDEIMEWWMSGNWS